MIVTANGICIPVWDTDVFICDSFEEFPDDSNETNDWGMILVPKTKETFIKGFGFSLLFAMGRIPYFESEMDLTIGGYCEDDTGVPVITFGKCRKVGEDQLEYGIETRQSMSGSPILIDYNGKETVIGIQ